MRLIILCSLKRSFTVHNPCVRLIILYPLKRSFTVHTCMYMVPSPPPLPPSLPPSLPSSPPPSLPPQISYASSATFFADRIRFRNFFRTHPSDGNSIPAVRSLIEYYGWKRVLVITQMENLFVEVQRNTCTYM